MAPFVCVQELFPKSQATDPMTIPLVLVTHCPDETVAPILPLILKLFPAPMLKLISPVEALPSVRVCLLVVPNVPSPVIYVALFPLLADIDAVGVFALTLMKANFALAVAVPPT